jgi:hypothetical protein
MPPPLVVVIDLKMHPDMVRDALFRVATPPKGYLMLI